MRTNHRTRISKDGPVSDEKRDGAAAFDFGLAERSVADRSVSVFHELNESGSIGSREPQEAAIAERAVAARTLRCFEFVGVAIDEVAADPHEDSVKVAPSDRSW